MTASAVSPAPLHMGQGGVGGVCDHLGNLRRPETLDVRPGNSRLEQRSRDKLMFQPGKVVQTHIPALRRILSSRLA